MLGWLSAAANFASPNEPGHAIAIRSNIRRQNLQRNFTTEFHVLGQIHLTHPARAEFGDNAVMRNRFISSQRLGHQFTRLQTAQGSDKSLSARASIDLSIHLNA